MLFIKSKSISDEDAANLIKSVSEVSISVRGYDPLLFARVFNLSVYAKTEMMTVLLCAFMCRLGLPHLFVGQLATWGSLDSAGCFCLCHHRNL